MMLVNDPILLMFVCGLTFCTFVLGVFLFLLVTDWGNR